MLGAWLAAASPAALFAEPPDRPGRASLAEDSSTRTAVDRWRRLKSLYPISEPAPAPSHRSADVPRAVKIEAPVLPIPDDSAVESERLAPQSNSPAPEPVSRPFAPDAAEPSLPSRTPRPALPVAPIDEEPAWVLPVVVEPEPEPESDFVIDPADDGGVHTLVPTHVVPAPVAESAAIAPEPAPRQSDSPARSATRQVSHDQIAPVRYRKIDTINPFRVRTTDGRESDNDIREYARKQLDDLNLAFGIDSFPARAFPATVKPWEAPNFFHYPLYFEDPALERYGHSRRPLIQPVVSIGRFSAQLIALPYLMTLDPPCCEVYSLGWYRPGECAPKLHYQVPLNAKAAAVEAATITGLVFLIP